MHDGKKPRILLFDIETAPILGYVWGLWDQNIALNQIKSDWHILSWAAKWLGDPPSKVMYKDQRHSKSIEDDKQILKKLWSLLNEADIVITQNGVAFDSKKTNARFILNGMKPPSLYRHIDTLKLAKKHFAFTSNKLEYMTEKLCKKYKKLKHKKFGGFELWKECLAGNRKAWDEMKKYNIHDVLALEELYNKLAPWGTPVDFNVFNKNHAHVCNCGSNNLKREGYSLTNAGKFQRFSCKECGAWTCSKLNLLSKDKRNALMRKA